MGLRWEVAGAEHHTDLAICACCKRDRWRCYDRKFNRKYYSLKRSTPPPFTLFNYTTTVLTFISVAKAKKDTIATTGPIPTYPKGKEQNPTTSNTAERDSRTLGSAWGGAFGGEEVNSHTRQKGKEEITQKDLQFFRASPLRARVERKYPREQALGYSPPHPGAPAHGQAEKLQIQKVRLRR